MNATMHDTATIRHDAPHAEQGFTLIELSIVLVIIGLIVGGILVGQDMIHQAEIQATVVQVEKYNTAVNTFRSKYNYIPGDIPSSVATSLGFFAQTGGNANTAGNGDGNGLLEGGAANSKAGTGETVAFWRNLTDASLVDGQYGMTTGTALDPATGQVGAALTTGTVNQIMPPAKLGRGNFITTYSVNGQNFYEIAGITGMTAAGAYTLTGALSPLEAQNIDQKIDDGAPLTGAVQAMFDAGNLGTQAAAGAATCVFTGGTQYNTTTTALASTPLCQLGLRFN